MAALEKSLFKTGLLLILNAFLFLGAVVLYRNRPEPPREQWVMKVDGETYDERRLIGDNPWAWYQAKSRPHAHMVGRVEHHLFERWVAEEAKKLGMTPGDYSRREVFHEPISATEKEILAFLDRKKMNPVLLTVEAEKTKIVNSLIGEKRAALKTAWVNSQKPKHQIEANFPIPESVLNWIPTQSSPMLFEGTSNTGRVIAFMDLLNGDSSKILPILGAISKKYGIPVFLKFITRPETPLAEEASRLGLCVFKVGGTRSFYTYIEKTLASQKTLAAMLPANVAFAQANLKEVKTCAEAKETSGQISADMRLLSELGLTGGWAVFFRDKRVNVLAPIDEVEANLDQALKETSL